MAMSILLDDKHCLKCKQPVKFSEAVVLVYKVSHQGMIHTEVTPSRYVTHVKCPPGPPVHEISDL